MNITLVHQSWTLRLCYVRYLLINVREYLLYKCVEMHQRLK